MRRNPPGIYTYGARNNHPTNDANYMKTFNVRVASPADQVQPSTLTHIRSQPARVSTPLPATSVQVYPTTTTTASWAPQYGASASVPSINTFQQASTNREAERIADQLHNTNHNIRSTMVNDQQQHYFPHQYHREQEDHNRYTDSQPLVTSAFNEASYANTNAQQYHNAGREEVLDTSANEKLDWMPQRTWQSEYRGEFVDWKRANCNHHADQVSTILNPSNNIVYPSAPVQPIITNNYSTPSMVTATSTSYTDPHLAHLHSLRNTNAYYLGSLPPAGLPSVVSVDSAVVQPNEITLVTHKRRYADAKDTVWEIMDYSDPNPTISPSHTYPYAPNSVNAMYTQPALATNVPAAILPPHYTPLSQNTIPCENLIQTENLPVIGKSHNLLPSTTYSINKSSSPTPIKIMEPLIPANLAFRSSGSQQSYSRPQGESLTPLHPSVYTRAYPAPIYPAHQQRPSTPVNNSNGHSNNDRSNNHNNINSDNTDLFKATSSSIVPISNTTSTDHHLAQYAYPTPVQSKQDSSRLEDMGSLDNPSHAWSAGLRTYPNTLGPTPDPYSNLRPRSRTSLHSHPRLPNTSSQYDRTTKTPNRGKPHVR